MLKLDFENTAEKSIKKSLFMTLFKKGLEILKREKKLQKISPEKVIHFVVVTDEEITELNRSYRGKESPTDVLSFSYYEEESFPGNEDLLGEIVISIDTAKKQAKEHKKTLQQEMQFLFVHGLLHLFGYDHEEEDEKKIMFDLQDEILETKSWRSIID